MSERLITKELSNEEVRPYYFSASPPLQFQKDLDYKLEMEKLDPHFLFDDSQIELLKDRFSHSDDSDILDINLIVQVHSNNPQRVKRFLWFDTSAVKRYRREKGYRRDLREWEFLGLSVRTHNALVRASISSSSSLPSSIRELESLSDQSLLSIRDIGEKSLEEIREKLTNFNERINYVLHGE